MLELVFHVPRKYSKLSKSNQIISFPLFSQYDGCLKVSDFVTKFHQETGKILPIINMVVFARENRADKLPLHRLADCLLAQKLFCGCENHMVLC